LKLYDCLQKLGNKLSLEKKKEVQIQTREYKKQGMDVKSAIARATKEKIAELESERKAVLDKIKESEIFKEEIDLMRRLKYESSGFYRPELEPKPFSVESRGKFAKTGMKGVGSPESYGEPPPSGENVSWSGREIRPLEVPELTRLAKELLSGKYPQVWKKLRLGVLGDFRPVTGRERIRIHAALGKDVEQLSKVLSHEIGHLIDFLPEGTLKRGNLLGRLAGLKEFMKNTLAADPKGLPPLTEQDRLRIRQEAKDILLKENAGKLIDEVIKKEIPITPQDILNIWNYVEKTEGFSSDLYGYIASLGTAEKKAIVKAALKGQVPEELKKFAKKIEEKTGKKVEYKPSKEDIAKKYKELIEAELKKRKAYTAQEIRNEQVDFTMRWKPFNPNANMRFTRYRLQGVELYADFLSAILTDPAFAYKYAPKSWELWHNYMENKPEVKSLYEQIQAELRSGEVDAKAEAALREGFSKKEREWAAEIKRKFNRQLAADELGYYLIDTSFAVLRRSKRVGETNIPDHINPRYKLSDLQYQAVEAEAYLTDVSHYILNRMKKEGIDIRDLDSYLFHRRVSTERAEKINPEGWTAERSSKKIEEYDRTMPALKEMAEKFDEIRKEMLLDNPQFQEMYSPALIKYIEENPGYATFSIVGFSETQIGPEATAQIFREPGIPGKIHRQVGTFRSTGPPLTATILNDIRVMRSVVRNTAARSIIGLYKSYPQELKSEYFPAKRRWNGKFHSIRKTAHPEMDTLIWMEQGQLHGAYLPKYVVKSIQRNPLEMNIFAKIARGTAAPFKAIFTQYNPGFMFFNVFRDLNKFTLMLPRMSYLRAIKWYAKALKPSYKRQLGIPDPVIKEMQKGKMLISVENYRGDVPEDRMADRLLKRYHLRPSIWNNKITKPFQLFFHHLDNVGRGIETMPKVAAYMYLKKRFPDLPEDFVKYFVRVGPGSPAFMQRGAAAAFYNNILLYSNAMKEGNRGIFQSVSVGGPETQKILSGKRRKVEFGYKLFKYHLLPKIAMHLALAGFFGVGIQKVMEGVSEYDMTNYQVIPIALTKSGRSVYLRIPQDEFGRLVGGIYHKLFRSAMNDPKWGAELADYMAGQVPSLSPMIGAIMDVGAYATGHVPYDFFRMRPAYQEDIGTAGGKREAIAFLKYMSNRMGGGIVHRFSTDNPHEIEKEIEKWIAIPGISNIIGRWIKISDYGVSEKIRKEALDPIREQQAERRLAARDGLIKMIQGKHDKVTDDERTAIFETDPTSLEMSMVKLVSRRYGSAWINAWASARTREEKHAVWNWAIEREKRLKAEGID